VQTAERYQMGMPINIPSTKTHLRSAPVSSPSRFNGWHASNRSLAYTDCYHMGMEGRSG